MTHYKLHWHISEKDGGMLLRDFLLKQAAFSNRLLIKVKQNDNGILVNGKNKTVRYTLQTGDMLEVTFPPEEISSYLTKEQMKLDILYEDDDILILNKPASIPTMPSRTHATGTLANGVLYYYWQHKIPYTVHVVTRLDRDTSGIVLLAKHQYSHSLLSRMQRQHQIKRAYTTFVHGYLDNKQGIIDAPIGRNPKSIIERMVTKEGQVARTNYKVLEERDNFSMVDVWLETGRTHQIRVHFSHLGHPLLGDELYGGTLDKINRQALHCSAISFVHPFTQQVLSIQIELPSDMANLSLC